MHNDNSNNKQGGRVNAIGTNNTKQLFKALELEN